MDSALGVEHRWHSACGTADHLEDAMIEIGHVLCPVDFSEFSLHALDHASAVARWYGARLTVLHVFLNAPVMDLPPLVLDEPTRDKTMADLRRFTAAVPADVPLDLRIEEAPDIHGEILAQAASLPADLLVVGSHGRSGFQRWVIGSTAEKLIRRSRCPTMIVPRRAHDTSPSGPAQFRHILCPVDFSDGSLAALEHALRMAEEADARLTLLHVIEVPPELRERAIPRDFDVDRVRAAAEAESLRRLRALVPDEARTYCTVETAVREGAAYREILHAAEQRTIDLVVMGLQGRGAIDLMVFGSNTMRVARGATCPVLIVRSNAQSKR
jgi:CPA2 family monovalent cation:H+ antiporter-2